MEEIIMTKTELIGVVAEKTEFTKKNAEIAVNAVISAITDSLSKGEKVSIVGFGTFEVRDRKAKQVKNPQTGKMMTAPASKAPAFKAGQALKNAVNKK
jgi:DNA-binding protein HU-beta